MSQDVLKNFNLASENIGEMAGKFVMTEKCKSCIKWQAKILYLII